MMLIKDCLKRLAPIQFSINSIDILFTKNMLLDYIANEIDSYKIPKSIAVYIYYNCMNSRRKKINCPCKVRIKKKDLSHVQNNFYACRQKNFHYNINLKNKTNS